MRLPIALLALLALASTHGPAGLFASAAKDRVKQLTSKNFDKVISGSPWTLVRGLTGEQSARGFELSRSRAARPRLNCSPHRLSDRRC